MSAPRRPASVPLAERKAELALLTSQIREHSRQAPHVCTDRRPCEELAEMKASQAQARDDIAHWFDPGPDGVPLFDLGEIA